MDHNQQINLSEQLQLLREVDYTNFHRTYQGPSTHRNRQSRDPDANRELRLLDTIALALTTGKPGDIYAAAFDKRKGMELVLAKNGPPTPDDIAAANELIALIGSPAVSHAMHLFPFLMRRCGDNINKRIRKLHASMQDGQDNYFTSALVAYTPEADITAEFPAAGELLGKYGDVMPPFATVWGDFVQEITSRISQWLSGEELSALPHKYSRIAILADALARSRFLKILIEDQNFANKDRREWAEKLKRRLDKARQYIREVTHLIQKAKRLFPIPHRWIVDNFFDTEESAVNLCENVEDAVLRGLKRSPLTQDVTDKLSNQFPSISNNWKTQQTVHPRVHPELRIILDLGPPSINHRPIHPIGASKRSCFCCTLWIEEHNYIFHTRWLTSGSNDKICANWALPGAACSYDTTNSVDEAVLNGVSMRLTDTLDWLFPGLSESDCPSPDWREWELDESNHHG